jgi:hypothetical protein
MVQLFKYRLLSLEQRKVCFKKICHLSKKPVTVILRSCPSTLDSHHLSIVTYTTTKSDGETEREKKKGSQAD